MSVNKIVTVQLSPDVWQWLNAKKTSPKEGVNAVLERMKLLSQETDGSVVE